MLFPEGDASPLKAWIVKRIENTSDADSDVLADYVIALLKHDGDPSVIRKLCEKEIPDFLTEDPKTFLDDVFDVIKHRSYIHDGPSVAPDAHPPQAGVAAHAGSKKRAFGDGADSPDGQRDQSHGDHRSFKQPRRGARRGPEDSRGGRHGGFGSMKLPPAPSTAMPQFDVNNPMEAFMQMQAMGMPFAGLQAYPPLNLGTRPQRHQAKRKGRCRDFDTKGFCSRGSTCLYDHGNESIYVPPAVSNGEEYDPNDVAMQMSTPHRADASLYAPSGARGRGGHKSRGNAQRGGRKGGARAPFSADGPVHDRSKSTIVVENILEERFSEDQVRGFFSQFGNIVEVSMQPYKHLAIVKYDNWDAANDAYRSPKVIFDNRFVKVFWYKEETESALGDGASHAKLSAEAGSVARDAEPDVDMEDLSRKQEEAQRQHQERQTKREELERQRQDLEKQQQDLLAKHQAETEQLRARLTEKNGSGTGSGTSATELLRAQLAALEQEAKILGLDPGAAGDGAAPGFRGGYRGRGGFRGRGGPRGRGLYRGQGARHAAYAQYSIDNRPRKLAVHGVDFTPADKDEVLRHFLLNLGEFESVETTLSVTHVSFRDRKTAEKFYHSLHGKELPGVEGRLELSWVGGSTAAAAAARKPADGSAPALSDDDEGAAKDEGAPAEMQQRQVDMDYEVGDDDAWDYGVQ